MANGRVVFLTPQQMGSLIERTRRERGMDQIELANAVGIESGSMSNIEKGKKRPGADLAKRIERALDLEPGQLVGPVTVSKVAPASKEWIVSLVTGRPAPKGRNSGPRGTPEGDAKTVRLPAKRPDRTGTSPLLTPLPLAA